VSANAVVAFVYILCRMYWVPSRPTRMATKS